MCHCYLSPTGENRYSLLSPAFSLPDNTEHFQNLFGLQSFPKSGMLKKTKDGGKRKLYQVCRQDLASLHNHKSECKLVFGFSWAAVHEVSSLPCHFKKSLPFCDSPRMFSHWDQLTISKARNPLSPTKCLPSYFFF